MYKKASSFLKKDINQGTLSSKYNTNLNKISCVGIFVLHSFQHFNGFEKSPRFLSEIHRLRGHSGAF